MVIEMKNAKEKKSKIQIFILIFRIISVIIIAVCLYVLYLWHLDNEANNNLQDDLVTLIELDTPSNGSEVPAIDPRFKDILDENNLSIANFNVDFNELLEKNEDSVAWVRIIGTNISYPVVQTKDNDFYLTHNILKEKNGAGWIFADYRNNFEKLDKNTIIYGHNRRNGTMFSNLKFYLDEEYCSDPNHKYINFNTKDQKYLAEIFSVYKTTPNNVILPNEFNSIIELQDTIDSWKESSIYDFKTDVTTGDKLLSLYTCDNNTTYRILVHAKLIPIN